MVLFGIIGGLKSLGLLWQQKAILTASHATDYLGCMNEEPQVWNKNWLKWVEIEGFKSIKKARFEPKRINVLIGEPNTGKSNILEALSLLRPLIGADKKPGAGCYRVESFDQLFGHYSSLSSNKLNISLNTNIGEAYLHTYNRKKKLDFNYIDNKGRESTIERNEFVLSTGKGLTNRENPWMDASYIKLFVSDDLKITKLDIRQTERKARIFNKAIKQQPSNIFSSILL